MHQCAAWMIMDRQEDRSKEKDDGQGTAVLHIRTAHVRTVQYSIAQHEHMG